MIEILEPVPVDEMPRPITYADEYASAEALEAGHAQPFKCADDDQAQRLYQAFWGWKVRGRFDHHQIIKDGSTIYVKRTA